MNELAQRILRTAFIAVSVVTLNTGCLETRDSQKEVDEKQVMRRQVQTLQQSTADVAGRFNDIEDEMRKINGRIEQTDAKVRQTNGLIDKGFGLADAKFKEKDEAYREEFAKLRSELESVKSQLASLQEDTKKAAQAEEAAARAAKEARDAKEAKEAEAAKNPFAVAEEKFEKKSWREAILDYEKYRKANPKGKQVATATYKIGVCFQELGLSEDARAFYEEVVSKYPKAKEAKSALTRLKKLK